MDLGNESINITGDMDSDCDLFPDSPGKCLALVYCKRVSAALSIIGVLFTLGVIVLFKKYKSFSQRLIVNLSVAALFTAVSFILRDYDSPRALCVFQAAFLTYSLWSAQLFILAILLNLYLSVAFVKDLQKYEKWLIPLCWGVPVIFMVLPFIGHHYGHAGVWCWLVNKWEWRFGIWYFWKILSMVVFIAVVIYMVIKLKQKTHERRSDLTAASAITIYEDIRTLRIYPIVYFLLTIFPTINRIHDAASGSDSGYEFVLLLLQAIFSPLFGGAVAVVFVLDRRTLNVLTVAKIKQAFAQRRSSTQTIKDYNSSSCNTVSHAVAREEAIDEGQDIREITVDVKNLPST